MKGTSPQAPQAGWTLSRAAVLAARLIVGAVFVYASLDKIRHPAAFAEAVHNYQILPEYLVNLAAIVLPWLELVLGGLLIAGRWVPGAALAANLLLAAFIAAMAYNLHRGLDIGCGCFTAEGTEDRLTAWTVARDALVLLPALWVLAASLRRPRPGGRSRGG